MIERKPPRRNRRAVPLGALLVACGIAHAADRLPVVEHHLNVTLAPATGTLEATDELLLPAPAGMLTFALHRDLTPRLLAGAAQLEPRGHDRHWAFYRVRLEPGVPLRLHYRGRLHQPLATNREGMGRSSVATSGTIDPAGVFLSGASGWYPRINGHLLRFQLRVTLPADWLAVSQGSGPTLVLAADATPTIGWREDQPQDELYLIAGRYRLYRQPTPVAEAQVWLREDDPALAQRYLAATGPYLQRYQTLIGAYPYAKFALVENFWESGYGMPSFTLLGAQTIRLPFLRDTAYPHEILHNWWGNGVFVAADEGNWSEGLTAYLADHLQRELAGTGAAYRHEQLQDYADRVRGDAERPLAAFHARHDQAEQALGYGKALMVFHMLRTMLGDEAFIAGLRHFYATQRGRFAGFAALRQAFADASGRDLDEFFAHWVTRAGAPELALRAVASAVQADGGVVLRGAVAQLQDAPPYPLTVPVVVHERNGLVHEKMVTFAAGAREVPFAFTLTDAPLRVAVDPAFDTFRRLAAGETPPRLSTLFGAPRGLILVPAAAPAPQRAAYADLARRWSDGHPGWTVALDRSFDTLPRERALWLLGWENRFITELTNDAPFALDPGARRLTVADETWDEPSAVLVTERNGQTLGWLVGATPATVPGLARKVPHYGAYGWLVFDGAAPDNRLKRAWPVGDTALMYWFDAARPALTLPARPTLIRAE